VLLQTAVEDCCEIGLELTR